MEPYQERVLTEKLAKLGAYLNPVLVRAPEEDRRMVTLIEWFIWSVAEFWALFGFRWVCGESAGRILTRSLDLGTHCVIAAAVGWFIARRMSVAELWVAVRDLLMKCSPGRSRHRQ